MLKSKIFKIVLAILLIGGAGAFATWFSLHSQIQPYKEFWNQKAKESGELIYVALGDSTAQGIGASEPYNSYVGVFARKIEESTGKKVRVINLSKIGARTDDVIGRQLHEFKSLKLKPDVLTMAIGTNDIYHATSQEDIASSMISILRQLPANSIVAEIPYLMWDDKNAAGSFINDAIHQYAKNGRIKVAPLYEISKEHHWDWSTYAFDFFHPNNKGYRNWAEAFWVVQK
jgi:acyl-CoA thioesterase I